MFVGAYIRSAQRAVIDLASNIFVLAVRIQSVYLLGQYLYFPVVTMSNYLIGVAGHLGNLAMAWEQVYFDIIQRIENIDVSNPLVTYASALIDFILNPLSYFLDWLYATSPFLYSLSINPGGVLRPYIQNIVDEVIDIARDVDVLIENKLEQYIPLLGLFRFSPVDWILHHLQELSGLVPDLLRDPKSWFLSELDQALPGILDFIRDPDGFIIERVIRSLENLADFYRPRILKIVETLLNRIF